MIFIDWIAFGSLAFLCVLLVFDAGRMAGRKKAVAAALLSEQHHKALIKSYTIEAIGLKITEADQARQILALQEQLKQIAAQRKKESKPRAKKVNLVIGQRKIDV